MFLRNKDYTLVCTISCEPRGNLKIVMYFCVRNCKLAIKFNQNHSPTNVYAIIVRALFRMTSLKNIFSCFPIFVQMLLVIIVQS